VSFCFNNKYLLLEYFLFGYHFFTSHVYEFLILGDDGRADTHQDGDFSHIVGRNDSSSICGMHSDIFSDPSSIYLDLAYRILAMHGSQHGTFEDLPGRSPYH
jgi:hypothetical protein